LKDAGVKFDNCSVQIVDEGKEIYESYYLGPKRVLLGINKGPLRDSPVYEAWRNQLPAYRRDLDEEDTYHDGPLARKTYGENIRSVLDVPFSYGTIAI